MRGLLAAWLSWQGRPASTSIARSRCCFSNTAGAKAKCTWFLWIKSSQVNFCQPPVVFLAEPPTAFINSM